MIWCLKAAAPREWRLWGLYGPWRITSILPVGWSVHPPPPAEDDDDDAAIAGDVNKLRTVRRVSRLLNTMMQAHDKQLIAANNDLICRLPAKEYGTMEFDMTDARKKALVDAARKAMNNHLAGRT